jgi:hypothetical protein
VTEPGTVNRERPTVNLLRAEHRAGYDDDAPETAPVIPIPIAIVTAVVAAVVTAVVAAVVPTVVAAVVP